MRQTQDCTTLDLTPRIPKSMPLVLLREACERDAYYSLMAILEVFWSRLNQTMFTCVLQAEKMNLTFFNWSFFRVRRTH